MSRRKLEQKFKSLAAFLIILILFPYIISVFVNGADPGKRKTEDRPDYLAGRLALELPCNAPLEAMKAQAVLIRTESRRNGSDQPDGKETEFLTAEEINKRDGMQEGRNAYEKYVRAVEETDGMVLLYQGNYAWTPFHQSSNGRTRSAEEVLGSQDYPYIQCRDCPADKEADDEIRVFSFPYPEIQEACRDFLVAETDNDKAGKGYSFSDFEILEHDSAGYVSRMRIGSTVCTGDQFRDALSLPSGSFVLSESADQGLQVTTTGKGHGLGMSIWTAEKMAEEGKTYEEILAFFFEGTELKKE